ncbi:MAG: hypothetical protein IJD13_03240 [Oscillospiraceae bacterium]|nr:hypothetical protein [Oscillospiraceae bacterium]
MANGEKFKKSLFGGFDRKDVIRCLEEMQQQNHAELEQLRLELETLRQERDTLRRRANELDILLTDRTDALEQSEEENASLREALEKAEGRAETLQKELSSQKALNSELLMKKSVLEENLRNLTARVQELEEKNPDRAVLALGELLVDAKVTADRIEEEARQRAAKSDAVVAAKCEETDHRIESLKGYVSDAMGALRSFCDTAMVEMGQVGDKLEDFRRAVRGTSPTGNSQDEKPVEEADDSSFQG